MGRFVMVVCVLVMLVPVICHAADSFPGLVYESVPGAESCVIGDKLIIICDYDKYMVIGTDSGIAINDFKDDNAQYSSIILIMYKDGTVYLVIEMPLTDGEFIDGTGVTAMSTQYLVNNMTVTTGK